MRPVTISKKSNYSNPSLHLHKLSQDLSSIDFISPKYSLTSRNTTTQCRNRNTPITPKEDGRNSAFTTTVFPWEKKPPKLPRDIKSLDTFTPLPYDRNPPDRHDAKLLLVWLDEMLPQIANNQNDLDEVYETVYKIYNFCLAEVVKQVSVQCKERGLIIEKVWKAYRTLFEKARKIQGMKMACLEEQHSSEKFRIHKMYNSQLRELEGSMDQLKAKYQSTLKSLQESEEACQTYEERQEKMKNRIEALKSRYKASKKEVLICKEEIRIIKFQIKNNVEKVSTEPTALSKLHHKIRVKSKSTIEKELENDPVLADISVVITSDQSNLMDQIKKYGIF